MGHLSRFTRICAAAAAAICLGPVVGWPAGEATAAPTRPADLRYRFVELGQSLADYSGAGAINEKTQVVVGGCLEPRVDGLCYTGSFVWDDGQLTPLGRLGEYPAQAAAINDRGAVAGTAGSTGFVWRDGYRRTRGLFYPRAINNRGWVAGFTLEGNGQPLAAVWRDKEVKTLAPPLTPPPIPDGYGTFTTFATGLNERGQILVEAGWYGNDGQNNRLYLWKNNHFRRIEPGWGYPYVPGYTTATDINAHGDVIGSNLERAFFWRNGVMTDLTGHTFSKALDINDRSDVVGTDGSHAFLWRNGRLLDLTPDRDPDKTTYGSVAINDHGVVIVGLVPQLQTEDDPGFVWSNGTRTELPLPPGWKAPGPAAINNRDEVVGTAWNPAEQNVAVMWVPVRPGRAS